MHDQEYLQDDRPTKRPRMTLSEGRKLFESNYHIPAPAIDEDILMSDDIQDFSPPSTPPASNKRLQDSTKAGRRSVAPMWPHATPNPSRQLTTHAASSSRSPIPPTPAHTPANSAPPATKTSGWKVLKAPDISLLSVPSPAVFVQGSQPPQATQLNDQKLMRARPVTSYASQFVLDSRGPRKLAGSGLRAILPPPPHPSKPMSARPMTSILETSFLKTYDPDTEDGRGELLRLKLLINPTGYVKPYDRELTRGIHQSPEKRRKNKEPKYIRGGLAARAAEFFHRRNTSVMTWYCFMDNKDVRYRPDLQLLILSVTVPAWPLSDAKHGGSRAPRVVLVRGIVSKSHSVTNMPQGLEITVLFRIPEGKTASSSSVAKDHMPKEGFEADVWRPWRYIDYAGQGGAGASNRELVACFERYRIFKVDDPEKYYGKIVQSRRASGPQPFPMQFTQLEAGTSRTV